MEIFIHNTESNDLFTKNRIRWQLAARKNNLTIIIVAMLGTVILLTSTVIKKDGAFYWETGAAFGLSFILFSLFYFWNNYRARKNFMSRTSELINNSSWQSQGVLIQINENGIIYKDSEMSFEATWTNYTHYTIFRDYLILSTHNGTIDAMVLGKNEMSPEQFKELTDFVDKILMKKK